MKKNKMSITRIITLIFGIPCFIALFGSLAVLNGWFFHDLGKKIPMELIDNLSVPFAIMGVAISIIASLTSFARGNISTFAGIMFHLVSVGITYTSVSFAINVQSSISHKTEETRKNQERIAALAEKQAEAARESANAAMNGLGNPEAGNVNKWKNSEINRIKNKTAYNSNGKRAGTVWEMTNGCTKTKGFYAKNYAQECEDIIKNIPAQAAQRLAQSSILASNLAQVEKSLDNQREALKEAGEAIKKHTPAIELPRIVEDEKLNKQIVTLTIALLFEFGLIILEWLLSGKIGNGKAEKTRKNSRAGVRQDRARCGKTEKTTKGSWFIGLVGATNLIRAIRGEKRHAARTRRELAKEKKELRKAKAELNSMNIVSGRDAMRAMTGFHISKLFRDAGVSINQDSSTTIALICRVYKPNGGLGYKGIYEEIKRLPECKESSPSTRMVQKAISEMVGVLATRTGEGKNTITKWLPHQELMEEVGEVRIAA